MKFSLVIFFLVLTSGQLFSAVSRPLAHLRIGSRIAIHDFGKYAHTTTIAKIEDWGFVAEFYDSTHPDTSERIRISFQRNKDNTYSIVGTNFLNSATNSWPAYWGFETISGDFKFTEEDIDETFQLEKVYRNDSREDPSIVHE